MLAAQATDKTGRRSVLMDPSELVVTLRVQATPAFDHCADDTIDTEPYELTLRVGSGRFVSNGVEDEGADIEVVSIRTVADHKAEYDAQGRSRGHRGCPVGRQPPLAGSPQGRS